MFQSITDPKIKIIPSKRFTDVIITLKSDKYCTDGVRKLKKIHTACENKQPLTLSTTGEDIRLINQLKSEFPDVTVASKQVLNFKTTTETPEAYLTVEDLQWINTQLRKKRSSKNGSDKTAYLHQLLEDCEILLPTNKQVVRNPVLEERCKKLRNQQQNREYNAMTKNVDSMRARLPEDSFAYQVKEMNKQLIAVLQFVISVLAGFAFGFIGVELIVGNLDFGFRLLLGIICSLVIALAEIYFLAKKLSEDPTLIDFTEKPTKVPTKLHQE